MLFPFMTFIFYFLIDDVVYIDGSTADIGV